MWLYCLLKMNKIQSEIKGKIRFFFKGDGRQEVAQYQSFHHKARELSDSHFDGQDVAT